MKPFQVLLPSVLTLLTGATTATSAEPRSAPIIIQFISHWLTSEYQLPELKDAPAILAVPSDELAFRRYGASSASNHDKIIALYDDNAATIFVSSTWTGHSIQEMSALVHEMVHHLQMEAKTVFACPAEREKLAYRAQNDFLSLFGEDLQSAFGVDPALILVNTTCIH